MERWVQRYVGIAYSEGGETHTGADCYGLVRLVYREVFKREAPSRPVTEQTAVDGGLRWEQSPAARAGDVVTFTLNGVPAHCGIVLESGLMLHAIRGRRVCVEAFDTAKWLRRFAGYFRLEDRP